MLKNPFTKKSSNASSSVQSIDTPDGTFYPKCTIRFLDDNFGETTLSYKKDTKGSDLMKELCQKFDLVDEDYFGLRYVDLEKQRHWLDLAKTVQDQLKHVRPKVLCFRVKFYPSDPVKVKHEQTRYYLFLQLRRDLYHGRLLCTIDEANLFAAYIIQSDIGDYEPSEHLPGYVASHKMLPKFCDKQEEAITEHHKTLRSMTPAEVELKLLSKAAQLDTYGIDPHPVKDQDGIQMYLGVTHRGIITFQGNKRKLLYVWTQVTKITFEGKVFIVHVTISEKKHACGFKCPTVAACKHLWKCAVEQQIFYTRKSAAEIPRAMSSSWFFRRGSTVQLRVRSEAEMFNTPLRSQGEPRVVRSTSNLNMKVLHANHNQSFGSFSSPYRVNGLSDTSLDSFSRFNGAPPSVDGDTSIATSPDQSVILEEDFEINSNHMPINDDEVNDLDLSNNNKRTSHNSSSSEEHNIFMSSKTQNSHPNHVMPLSSSSQFVSSSNDIGLGSMHKPFIATGPSRLVIFAWAIILATVFISATLAAFALVVLEFDTELAILSDIQRLPEICAFRRERYTPWRNWFLGEAGGNVIINRFQC